MGKSVVVTLGPWHEFPWWWEDVKKDKGLCDLSYCRFDYRGKGSQQVKTIELASLFYIILKWLFTEGRKFEYIFTFECDLPGFIISFWQTVLFWRKPKHVILQFIMREKQDNWRSKLKYLIMKVTYSSIHKVVCSSRRETEYYRRVFGWQPGKAEFVLFHSVPEYLSTKQENDGYVLAAGRSFRDYDTLIAALKGTNLRLVLVGGQGTKAAFSGVPNVDTKENIPMNELKELIERAKVVVVPLEDRKISTGQTIFLVSMAMSKAVIATRTTGTEDYIQDGKNGILVEPKDVQALRKAMLDLDDKEAVCIGKAAHQAVLDRHLPHHYTAAVRRALDPDC